MMHMVKYIDKIELQYLLDSGMLVKDIAIKLNVGRRLIWRRMEEWSLKPSVNGLILRKIKSWLNI